MIALNKSRAQYIAEISALRQRCNDAVILLCDLDLMLQKPTYQEKAKYASKVAKR